jgi:hypothetical protein
MGYPAKLVSDMLALDNSVIGVIAPKRQIDLKKVATLARSEPETDVAICAGARIRGVASSFGGSCTERVHRGRRLRRPTGYDPRQG